MFRKIDWMRLRVTDFSMRTYRRRSKWPRVSRIGRKKTLSLRMMMKFQMRDQRNHRKMPFGISSGIIRRREIKNSSGTLSLVLDPTRTTIREKLGDKNSYNLSHRVFRSRKAKRFSRKWCRGNLNQCLYTSLGLN